MAELTKKHVASKAKMTVDKSSVFTCILSMLLTSVVILIAYVMLGFAPFGDRAFLYKDGQQQMIDLFCWLKDALTGKSSIDYTFTKYLGGSNFAVFSYYLSSPFSLLIVFFRKDQASLFLNVLLLIKASVASLFAAYYILRRFKPETRTKYAMAVMLSASYGLSQYFIAQSANVMWLDGGYMLPLLLAGIEKLVNNKKSTLFVVSAALAVCFNWYTGLIDLLFAGFWFLFESARVAVTGNTKLKKQLDLKGFLYSVIRFATASISAILISCILLLPSYMLLAGRSYGNAGIGELLDFTFLGFIPNVISSYSFGTVSIKGSVSLFAGSPVLLGTVLLFVSSSKTVKEKLLYGAFLLTVILTFYWQPLVAMFSLLRIVESFWYRYGYTGCFAVIYLAAVFYLETDIKKVKAWVPPCIAAAFSIIVFFMTDPASAAIPEIYLAKGLSEILHIAYDQYLIPLIAKMVFPILTSLLLCLAISLRKKKSTYFRAGALLLSIVSITELLLGQMVLSLAYSTTDTPYMEYYTNTELELLSRIEDPAFYRIVQTSYHSNHHNLPASYNEPMAYGFNSVSSFVSAPDENSVWFLGRAGYQDYYDTIPATVSENLALDSLMSVKYVLLPYGDENNSGLIKLAKTEGFKELYLNPYAVPAAFVISNTGDYESSDTTCPALYLNDHYRYLSGIDKDIYIPIDPELISCEITDEDGRNVYTYTISSSSDDSLILYADLLTNTDTGADLYMNGELYTSYTSEMAPSMVRIRPENGKIELKLVFKETQSDLKVTDAQFYALDLKILNELTLVMSSKAPSRSNIRDGYCYFELSDAKPGSSLFTSIAYNKGWTITRNGVKVDCDLTGDTFMTIPLEEGQNVIEMRYSVPYKNSAIAISAAGILLLAGMIVFENRKKKISK